MTIGVDNYTRWPALKNAVGDARGVQKVLTERYGFEAPLPPLVDAAATKSAIEQLLADRLRETLKPEDSLILFFAGHGTTRSDEVGGKRYDKGYIVPVDAPRDTWSAYLPVDELLESAARLPARHVLVILDACSSGIALGSGVDNVGTRADAPRYTAELASKVSRRVITSARSDQTASDAGPVEGHSLFTGHLVQGLALGSADTDGDGFVLASELGDYVARAVRNAPGSQQVPDFGAFDLDDRGELVLPLGQDTVQGRFAQARAALTRADRAVLATHLAALRERAPTAPMTRFLTFREALLRWDIESAVAALESLRLSGPRPGAVPLSIHEMDEMTVRLRFWRAVLHREDEGAKAVVEVLVDDPDGPRVVRPAEGGAPLRRLRVKDAIRLRIKNTSTLRQHFGVIAIDADGRLEVINLWPLSQITEGLAPGERATTKPARLMDAGLHAWRVVAGPELIDPLMLSRSLGGKAASLPPDPTEIGTATLLFVAAPN